MCFMLCEDAGGAKCKFEQVREAKAKLLSPVPMPKGAGFHESMLARMCAIFDACGGPRQYLDSIYKSSDEKQAFKKHLEEMLPRDPHVEYHKGNMVPSHKAVFTVHLVDCTWEEWSSTKPAPYKHTCKALVDQFLAHGYLTEHEPLLLSAKPCPVDRDCFWVSFVKGAARAATALALAEQLLVCCNDEGDEVSSYCPDLVQSLCVIKARVHVSSQDETAIAFENAKMSSRGAIRRAHDVITWLGCFTTLRKSNPQLDASVALNSAMVWHVLFRVVHIPEL